MPVKVKQRQKVVGKFQENPWNAWILLRVANRTPKRQILTFSFDAFIKNSQNISCKTFHLTILTGKNLYFTEFRLAGFDVSSYIYTIN